MPTAQPDRTPPRRATTLATPPVLAPAGSAVPAPADRGAIAPADPAAAAPADRGAINPADPAAAAPADRGVTGPADCVIPAGPHRAFSADDASAAPEAPTALALAVPALAVPAPAVPAPAVPAPAVPAPAADSSRRKAFRLALILVASFMMVLDFSIVNVALPSIERELNLSTSLVDWVVTAYAIAFGGLLILGGRAADMLGRRRMFVIGLVAFSLASLSGGLAQDPVLLLASRVVQGAGAAVVMPAALSLITTGFADGRERTRALGVYGATASLGFVAGQVLGGVLVEFTSWRAVFLVNVPVGLIAAIIAPKVLGRSANLRGTRAGHRLDVRGALLITSAVALAVFAVSEGDTFGWLSPVVLGAAAAAAIAFGAFALAETRHPEPLIRLDMFRHAGLRRGSALALLMGLWNGGEMLVLSLYFQQVLHESPLVTGLAIAPQGMAGFTAGMFGTQLAARFGGVRRLLAVTAAASAAGFLVLTQLPAAGYSPLLLAVMLIGFGTAGTAFGSIVIASRGVPDSDQGVVGGMINTSRQIGAAIGAALLPAVALGVGHEAGVSGVTGDRAAMLTGAVASVLAMLLAWRASRAGDPVAQPR